MIASCRWLGRRPEGPGAEATRKDFTPFRIHASVRGTAGGDMEGEDPEGVSLASL